MSKYLGDIAEDATIRFMWDSFDSSGASVTRATNGTISVYKDGGLTQSTAGITDTEDFDSLTGVHLVAIDTSADAFYATGSDYSVVLSAATIDGQTVNAVLAEFSIENRFMRGTDSAFLAANAPTNFSDLSVSASTGLVDVATIADGAITAAKIAADAITAAKIADDAITSDQLSATAVAEIWGNVCETNGSRTAQQILSILLSALAGVTSNGGATLSDPSGSNTRITATVNASNERTAITLTPSS